MGHIEKLLQKISKKDRERLLFAIETLIKKNGQVAHVGKIKNTDFYRLKSGHFRIVFHYESKTREIIIDSIRLRNDNTYKNL